MSAEHEQGAREGEVPRQEDFEERRGPYDWSWLAAGARKAASLPGLVMAMSFIGFGALLHSMNLPLAFGVVTDVFVWALPGQVVMTDNVSRGLPLLVTAFAVSLTAVRLLPMVVLVLSRARREGNARWPEYIAAYFIAATIWVMAEMFMGQVPRRGRVPWLIGLGCALISAMSLFTIAGFYLTGMMPKPLAVTLVFFTPSFFLLALVGGAGPRMDWLAIALGLVIGPLTHLYWPRLDLLAAGIIGGGAAFALARPAGREAA